MQIGIIGAGISALILARQLRAKGVECQIFEKARGVSGRMSTRYAGIYEFDHGAQFITAQDPIFQSFVDDMCDAAVMAPWHPRTGEFNRAGQFVETQLTKKLYVAQPRMNSLARYLGEGLDIKLATRIDQFEKQGQKWLMVDESGTRHGPFDYVVSSAPAPQSRVLFDDLYPDIEQISASQMRGAFTLMLGFETPLEAAFDMARPLDSLLSTISLNSSKPGRPDQGQCWVLQTDQNWSEIHMEDDKDSVIKRVMEEACRLTGLAFDQADHLDLHRWRYAIAAAPLDQGFYLDPERRLAMCGDWCAQNKVEGAFMSGFHLAKALTS